MDVTEMTIGRGLHLGIDATNIRFGGGVTHLSQLIRAAEPVAAGVSRVTIWACRATAQALPRRQWLKTISPAWMEGPLLLRVAGQLAILPRAFVEEKCDVVFFPGGIVPRWTKVRTVAMAQNMLVFEPEEARRFGKLSAMRAKLRLLREAQGRSFRRADGVIFLTRYAEKAVLKSVGGFSGALALIPHGVEGRFTTPPKRRLQPTTFSTERPFRVLYVSSIMPYKHQKEVAMAIRRLRVDGLPIVVRFVGESRGRYGRKIRRVLRRLDPTGESLVWKGAAPFEQIHEIYQEADAFVFASSCENLPNILIEAMAAGLPIASSNRGPMPEVLGDGGVYFDPESVESIADAVRALVTNAALRTELSAKAVERAQNYSWEECARETFRFIASVGNAERLHAN